MLPSPPKASLPALPLRLDRGADMQINLSSFPVQPFTSSLSLSLSLSLSNFADSEKKKFGRMGEKK